MHLEDLLPTTTSIEEPETVARPERVAMLSVHTSPLAALGGRDTGGMNVYIRQLATELAERGVHVDVYTRKLEPDAPLIEEDRLGFRTTNIPAGPQAPVSRDELYSLLPEWTDAVDAYRASQDFEYDILHSHYWLSGLAAEHLARRWGVPWAHMSHTLALLKDAHRGPHQEPESPLRIRSEARVLQEADVVIASNPVERGDVLQRYHLEPESVLVAPCGVDLALFRPSSRCAARERLGIRRGQRVALYVGRIEPLKGLDTLLRAAAILRTRVSGLRVIVVGGSSSPADTATHEELARLTALASELGVEDAVEFYGPVPQRELPDMYRAADVTVMPSHYESFGMAALESLACGTPVVASDVGGLRSTIRDGANGYLVTVDDERAFARRIEKVLCRPELAARLSQRAARTARRYSWQRVADANLAIYHNLLARQNAAVPTSIGYELTV